MEAKRGGLMKNAFFMVFATIFAKALGLVRDMLVASNYGTTVEAVAYDAASRLPILLFDLVIGGVVTAAFIPIFNEILVKKGQKKAFEFADSYITGILLITVVISALGVIFAGPLVNFLIPDVDAQTKLLAIRLTRIMFPMVVFTGLAFSFVGVLLSLNEFKIPAIISLVSNGVIVIYLFTLNKVFGVIGLSLSLVFGWLLQAFVQLPRLNSLGYRYRLRFQFATPYMKQAMRGALPILLGTWTGPVCALINTRFASAIENGRAVTALGYANRFYTIIIGVFSYVATNLLFPYISKAAAGGEKKEANKLMLSSIRVLMLVIIPITAGIIVLSDPLISLLYERGEFNSSDTRMTAEALSFYTFGMVFAAANEVLTKAFFARKDFKLPMYASLCSMAVNFALVFPLSRLMGIGGIALASGVAVMVSCLFNYIALRIKEGRLFVFSDLAALLKMAVSAVVMAVCVHFVTRGLEGDLAKLLCGVGVGVMVYFASAALMRVDEVMLGLKTVAKMVKKRNNSRNYGENGAFMIKILNVITDTNIGGAGRILVHYLKNFDKSKYEVTVAVPSGSLLIPEIKATGHKVIETAHGHDRSFEPGGVVELYKIIKSVKPDIVHTHSSLSAKIAAYLAGVRSRIYTRHCAYDLSEKEKSFPRRQISGFVNNTLSTAIIAVAPAAAENLTDTGVKPEKITVIMNGVEPMRRLDVTESRVLCERLGIEDDDFVCFMCARLEEVKGHEYFIKAAKILGKKYPKIKFLIIGTGSVEENLKRLVSELGVEKAVIFAGFTDDVTPYLNIGDLCVNCSWGTEASSLAIAEAMSLSIPTVASMFGGNPSVISDGENGILVPKRDENALADAIARIYDSPELYKKLSEGSARIFAERFTSEAMTRKLESIYDKEANR